LSSPTSSTALRLRSSPRIPTVDEPGQGGDVGDRATNDSEGASRDCLVGKLGHVPTALRAKQHAQRLRLGEPRVDSGFLFTEQLGQALYVRVLVAQIKALIKKSGLPDLRLHDLEHISSTLLLAQVVHPKIVQERPRHADIAMTLNRYSNVMPDMQRSAADSLDAAFTRMGSAHHRAPVGCVDTSPDSSMLEVRLATNTMPEVLRC